MSISKFSSQFLNKSLILALLINVILASSAYAMGAPQGGQAPSGGDVLMQFVPLLLMFAIFYFLLIRPQQKRAKQHRAMLESLKRGDKIVTSSGFIGRVVEIDGEEVTIECGDSKLRISRGAIGSVQESSSSSKAERKAEKAKTKLDKTSDKEKASEKSADKSSESAESKETEASEASEKKDHTAN